MWSRTAARIKRLPLRRSLSASSDATTAIALAARPVNSGVTSQYSAVRLGRVSPAPSQPIACAQPEPPLAHYHDKHSSSCNGKPEKTPQEGNQSMGIQKPSDCVLVQLAPIRLTLAHGRVQEAELDTILSGGKFCIRAESGYDIVEFRDDHDVDCQQVLFEMRPVSEFWSGSGSLAFGKMMPPREDQRSGIYVNELYVYESLANGFFHKQDYARACEFFGRMFGKYQALKREATSSKHDSDANGDACGSMCSFDDGDQWFQSLSYAQYIASLKKLEDYGTMLTVYQQGFPMQALVQLGAGYELLLACKEEKNAIFAVDIIRQLYESQLAPLPFVWLQLASWISLTVDEDAGRGLANAMKVAHWVQQTGYEVSPRHWRYMARNLMGSGGGEEDIVACVELLPKNGKQCFVNLLHLIRQASSFQRCDLLLMIVQQAIAKRGILGDPSLQILLKHSLNGLITSRVRTNDLIQCVAMLEEAKVPVDVQFCRAFVEHLMRPSYNRDWLPRECVRRFVDFVGAHKEWLAPCHSYLGAKAAFWCFANGWRNKGLRELDLLVKEFSEHVLEHNADLQQQLAVDVATRIMRKPDRLDSLQTWLKVLNAHEIRLDSECTYQVVRYYLQPSQHPDTHSRVDILEDFLYFFEQHVGAFVSHSKALRFAMGYCGMYRKWIECCERLMHYCETDYPFTTRLIVDLLVLFEEHKRYSSCLELLQLVYRKPHNSPDSQTYPSRMQQLVEDEESLMKVLNMSMELGMHSRVALLDRKYDLTHRFPHNQSIGDICRIAHEASVKTGTQTG